MTQNNPNPLKESSSPGLLLVWHLCFTVLIITECACFLLSLHYQGLLLYAERHPVSEISGNVPWLTERFTGSFNVNKYNFIWELLEYYERSETLCRRRRNGDGFHCFRFTLITKLFLTHHSYFMDIWVSRYRSLTLHKYNGELDFICSTQNTENLTLNKSLRSAKLAAHWGYT